MEDFHENLVEVAHAYTSLGLERFHHDLLRVLREDFTDAEENPFALLIEVVRTLLDEGRTILRLHDVFVFRNNELMISSERLLHFLSELIMVIQAWPYKTFQEKMKKERHLQLVTQDLV